MHNYDLYKHSPVYTTKELLEFCVKEYSDKEAFAYQNRRQDISVGFTEFNAQINAFGSYLFTKGYNDKHIAVFGENSYEWILTHFAVTCGKGVIVPIDKELDAGSIAELLLDSESKVMVYSDTYADVIECLQAKLPEIIYINMRDIPSLIEKGKELIASGYTDYLDIAIDKDDLASVVYTSGTTGKSKGVMLTHGNIATNTVATCQNVLIEGPTVLLLPLHHMFGLVAGVMCVLFYGYSVYINASLKRITNDFQMAQPQHLSLVPIIVETLYKRIWLTAEQQGKANILRFLTTVSNVLLKCKIDLRKALFKSVFAAFGGNLETIISGGAGIDDKYIDGFKSFGITIINGYGITECSPVVATIRNKAVKKGTVGFPLSCNEIKIKDPDDNGIGEILVRGSNVMVGYYKDESATMQAFCDDWFRTGDLGRIDSEGYLAITGRIKNLIILSNGENISAESIESQVYTIPYVKEVVAYGKDDVIVAEVFLDEEVADARDRIHMDIQAINQKLPVVKNIGKVVIRDTEFPKTTTKKIKRNYGG